MLLFVTLHHEKETCSSGEDWKVKKTGKGKNSYLVKMLINIQYLNNYLSDVFIIMILAITISAYIISNCLQNTEECACYLLLAYAHQILIFINFFKCILGKGLFYIMVLLVFIHTFQQGLDWHLVNLPSLKPFLLEKVILLDVLSEYNLK